MPGFIPGFIQPSCKLPVLIHCLQVAAVVTGEVEEDFRPRRSGWPWWGLIGNAAVISVPLLIWVAYRRVFSTPVQVSTGGGTDAQPQDGFPQPLSLPRPICSDPRPPAMERLWRQRQQLSAELPRPYRGAKRLRGRFPPLLPSALASTFRKLSFSTGRKP